MPISKETVDTAFKTINEFEQIIPGIRYGEDYPQFALAIVGSESFNSMVTSATMLGMLSTFGLPKNKEDFPTTPEGNKEFVEKLVKESPMREILLRALYLGYKLGKEGISE